MDSGLTVVGNCKTCKRPLYDGPRRYALLRQAAAIETAHIPRYAYFISAGWCAHVEAAQLAGWCGRCYSRRLSDIPKEGLAFGARVADRYETQIAQLLRQAGGRQ